MLPVHADVTTKDTTSNVRTTCKYRYVIITTKEGTVESVIVEQNPGELTITDAKTVLANLS
ncbi:hypothetical protein K525DRAFT_274558 [Schizophyllum commune Loenen D]|nr:hypothetical protein K525DRAFT_274558 [Schizophyllum commune Loenen D]